jgi:OFA family oxalate/formate antiporter-like MFS transporter
MSERSTEQVKNLGWRVTMAGVGINLALGILYTWSVISKEIPAAWGWKEADKSWPYAIACLVFSLTMVPAGRMQDKIGPRLVAAIGGLLVGLGMMLASMGNTPLMYMLGFGLLAGAGIGFGYASATPPAVKWFPARRTGLIAGLVVSGFGLAAVWASPTTKWLIAHYGIPGTMFGLGIAFLIVVVGLAQLLVPPPKGFVPAGAASTAAATAKKENFGPGEMLATWQFYLLWFMYACGAGAGLMVIAKLAALAKQQANLNLGFLLVVALSIGNGGGRILAGVVSDKIGRQLTMFGCFVLQAVLMVLLAQAQAGTTLATAGVMAVLSALIGANYGANLSLFPSITKDYYGLKNFGVNYGLVFTAWGIGGFLLSMLAGKLYDLHATYTYSCYTAAVLLVAAALASFAVRPPQTQSPS